MVNKEIILKVMDDYLDFGEAEYVEHGWTIKIKNIFDLITFLKEGFRLFKTGRDFWNFETKGFLEKRGYKFNIIGNDELNNPIVSITKKEKSLICNFYEWITNCEEWARD